MKTIELKIQAIALKNDSLTVNEKLLIAVIGSGESVTKKHVLAVCGFTEKQFDSCLKKASRLGFVKTDTRTKITKYSLNLDKPAKGLQLGIKL